MGIGETWGIPSSGEKLARHAAGPHSTFWIFEPLQRRIRYVHPSYFLLTGQSCESLYEDVSSFTEVVAPEDRASVSQLFPQAFPGEEEADCEFRMHRGNGEVRWLHGRMIGILPESSGQVAVIMEDVTGRKQIEQQLRESEKLYRELFEHNPMPMWVYDSDTLAFLAVNEAAIRHYGYSREEFLGMTLGDVRPPEDYQRMITAHRSGVSGLHHWGVWRHRKKNGALIDVDVATHDLRFPGWEGRLALLHDVTEQRRLEEQLHQSQKMEAVGRLAGGIAHDFNNLLTIMNGRSELLLDQLAQEDPYRRAVEEIARAGERAARLVRQLLTFSRRQVIEARIVDLNRLVDEMETMLRRVIGEDVELVTRYSPHPLPVKIDTGRMEQVIMNLAVNARDAMPNGGWLSLELRAIPAGEVCADPPPESGSCARMVIRDTGIGMDEAVRSRIFEPFYTTKSDGTGLGLSTAYGIVHQCNGWISVESEPGEGTTFTIDLPMVMEPAVEDASDATPAPESQSRYSILLVEDEEGVRALIEDLLRSSGFTLSSHSRAEDALAEWEHSKQPLDLLLTDLVLPGLAGPELAHRMLQQRPKLKVLFISGYADPVAREMDAEHEFLPKPFALNTLLEKVRLLLATTAAE